MSEDWKQATYGWVNAVWIVGLLIVNWWYANREKKDD